MVYTTFTKNYYDTLYEPIFFGKNINILSNNLAKYKIFNEINNKLLDGLNDNKLDIDLVKNIYFSFNQEKKDIFLKNLKYLLLISSIEVDGISSAFSQIVSLPEIKNFFDIMVCNKVIFLRQLNLLVDGIIEDKNDFFKSINDNNDILLKLVSFNRFFEELIVDTGFYYTRGEGLYFVARRERRVSLRILKKEAYFVSIILYIAECLKNSINLYLFKNLCNNNKVNNYVNKIEEKNKILSIGLNNIINICKSTDDIEMSEMAVQNSADIEKIFKENINNEMKCIDYIFKDCNDNNLKNNSLEFLKSTASKMLIDVNLNINI